jgi:hypothetical protein
MNLFYAYFTLKFFKKINFFECIYDKIILLIDVSIKINNLAHFLPDRQLISRNCNIINVEIKLYNVEGRIIVCE